MKVQPNPSSLKHATLLKESSVKDEIKKTIKMEVKEALESLVYPRIQFLEAQL
jgi:hypothetical protein